MAINIPIITEFSDAGLKSARGAFDQFKGKVAEAEGGMGKFKAGAGVAMDSVKANAGIMAVAAGGAIAGFALKAIGDFQDLALGVDEFRNKTDLTLQQSSKWVSYTGDLGIEADAMTKIFSRLAKAATDEIPAFEELGVAIAFGPDGSTDIEETFLRVNDAINALDDPVAEAAYRADLFGKGWMNAAELVQMGSDDIRVALDGVKDFEVIDEEEIEKAKDLRAAQDELADAMARLSVKLGEALLPAFTALLDAATPLLELLGKIDGEAVKSAGNKGGLAILSGMLDDLGLGFATANTVGEFLNDTLSNTTDIADDQAPVVSEELAEAWKTGYEAMIDAQGAAEDLGDELMTVDEALGILKGNVDERREWDNLITAIDDAKEAAWDAFMEATPEALRESQLETDEARLKVAEYILEMDNIPDEKKTEMIADLDDANLAEIEATFNYLARNRVSHIEVITTAREQAGTSSGMGSGRNQLGFGIRSSAAGNVVVNVAGSVIAEGDLVEKVRVGLVKAQRNGSPLVYSNQ